MPLGGSQSSGSAAAIGTERRIAPARDLRSNKRHSVTWLAPLVRALSQPQTPLCPNNTTTHL